MHEQWAMEHAAAQGWAGLKQKSLLYTTRALVSGAAMQRGQGGAVARLLRAVLRAGAGQPEL